MQRPEHQRIKLCKSMTQPTTKGQTSTGHAGASLPKTRLRVALVEDQPKVRESWTRLINSFPDFSCVCACMSGEEAIRVIPPQQPDVILMDIFLPRMPGIECTARLKTLLPQVQMWILTVMDATKLVSMA